MEMSSPRAKATYHNVRLFIIFILAVTFCYPALIDTTVIRSEVRFNHECTRKIKIERLKD